MERVWLMDESRFGLKVHFRRRWCPYGWRPPWVYEDKYQWLWLYEAVDPLSGESFSMLLPGVDCDCLRIFLKGFREEVGGEKIGLILDNSPSHRSKMIDWSSLGIEPVYLPPYSPELNPVELIFRELKGRLSNEVYGDLSELEERICDELRGMKDEGGRLKIRFEGYRWLREAIENIRTRSK